VALLNDNSHSAAADPAPMGMTVVRNIDWLMLVVFVVLAFAGLLRPTGLWSRTPAQQEEDRIRPSLERWLKAQDHPE
jgi:hypothetical protein